MTIETNGPTNDQYLYVPAIGRPRQIASQDRQNNLEDTGMINEDLGALKLDDYTTILEIVRAEVDSGIDPLDFDKEKMGAAWKESF